MLGIFKFDINCDTRVISFKKLAIPEILEIYSKHFTYKSTVKIVQLKIAITFVLRGLSCF